MSLVSSLMAEQVMEEVEVPIGVQQDIQEAFDRFALKGLPSSRAEVEAIRGAIQTAIDPINTSWAPRVEAWVLVEGGEILVWFERNGRRVNLVAQEGGAA